METWAQVALEIRILTVVGRMGEIDCSQQTDKCITILAGVVVFYHMHDASPMFQQINVTYHHVTLVCLV